MLVLAAAMGLGLAVPVLMQPNFEVLAAPAASGEDGTRDTITPTSVLDTGVEMTLAAASGDGHKFANTGDEIVVVTNDYTATVTLTVVTGGTAGGHPIDDVDIELEAGETTLAGPFETAIFNQTSGSDAGRVYLTFDATVTGTVADSVTLNVYRVQ
jgi:hypothetical protein